MLQPLTKLTKYIPKYFLENIVHLTCLRCANMFSKTAHSFIINLIAKWLNSHEIQFSSYQPEYISFRMKCWHMHVVFIFVLIIKLSYDIDNEFYAPNWKWYLVEILSFIRDFDCWISKWVDMMFSMLRRYFMSFEIFYHWNQNSKCLNLNQNLNFCSKTLVNLNDIR